MEMAPSQVLEDKLMIAAYKEIQEEINLLQEKMNLYPTSDHHPRRKEYSQKRSYRLKKCSL